MISILIYVNIEIIQLNTESLWAAGLNTGQISQLIPSRSPNITAIIIHVESIW